MGKEIKKVDGNETPARLIQLAMDKGADLEKLEKLLTLQERYEKNEARKEYHKAMAAFKADAPKIDKDKKVGYLNVKYSHASLYNVTDKINTVLSKHGLSASWGIKQNGAVVVTCKITHVKGHSEETSISAQPDTSGSKNSIQAIGSTISYLCRYSLLCLTGLATQGADDDGKAAETAYIDDKEKGQLLDLIAEKGVEISKFCKFFKIEELEKLPKEKFNQAFSVLKARTTK